MSDLVRIVDLEGTAGAPFVLALAGWGDASGVASGAARRLAAEGNLVAEVDSDRVFDFRSNRPVLHFSEGNLDEVVWPSFEIVRADVGGQTVLVGSGSEPDFRWQRLTAELVDLGRRIGVSKLVTLGAVPAPVPHTRPVRVVCTVSDDGLLAPGDEVLHNELVVPAAAVSIIRAGFADAGIPAVGYWAQVPHYVNEPYHAGELALLEHLSRQLGIDVPVGTVAEEAAAQREELDRIVAGREDARAYVAKLESAVDAQTPPPSFESLPTADELVDEIERFLRDSTGEQ